MSGTTRTRSSIRVERLLLGGLLLLFVLAFVKTAWVGDDAYITFRTIDNFSNGYGLRWNVDERVQVYTHPLWMFALSSVYRYTGDVYLSAILLSALASLGAIATVAFGTARSTRSAVLAVSMLLLSRAFVDFSSSGLENPLTHLLLGSFVLIALRSSPTPRAMFAIACVAGLGALNRMDSLLLFLPLLALLWWKGDRMRGAAAVALGFLPFVAWEAFSLFYYGFLFPNTAYAKLQTGLGRGDLLAQGLSYLANSLIADPFTLIAILSAAALAVVYRSRVSVALILGMAAYLVYVVWVGGDFMSGRFLTPVLFCAALLVSRLELDAPSRPLVLATCVLAGVGCLGVGYRVLVAQGAPLVDRKGIADERRIYYPTLGMLEVAGRSAPPEHELIEAGLIIRDAGEPVVQLAGVVGLLGYHAGPSAHILDVHGLGDPLLARLPAQGEEWRIGHFFRQPRADYIRSLQTGENLLVDRDLALYYDKLRLITRGKLFDRERLTEIVRFNLGQYEHLRRAYLDRRNAAPPAPFGP